MMLLSDFSIAVLICIVFCIVLLLVYNWPRGKG